MARPEAGGEMSMLPRLGNVEPRIVFAGVVAYPFISVDVRGGRMSGFVRRLLLRPGTSGLRRRVTPAGDS